MKKYIALAFALGYIACMASVFAFGAYTRHRIEQIDREQAQQMQKKVEQIEKNTDQNKPQQ